MSFCLGSPVVLLFFWFLFQEFGVSGSGLSIYGAYGFGSRVLGLACPQGSQRPL